MTSRRKPRLIVRVYHTDRCEDGDLGRAAIATTDCEVRGWHVTDDPKGLAEAVRRGDIIDPKYEYRELGPGLYISAIPHYWASRSTDKWGFLKRMTKAERKMLAETLAKELVRLRGARYISESEADRALGSLDRWIDEPDEWVAYIAAQPYNITFWKSDFLEPLGLGRLAEEPKVVEVRAVGRFVELNRTLYGTEWRRFARRFDGAYLRQGMATDAQLVIWNPKAITFIGEAEPLS